MENNYKLRAVLDGHSSDVRAIAVNENDIATASRDRTSILWVKSDDSKIFLPGMQYLGHSSYVNSICLVPPQDGNEEGFLVTGSQDKNILVFPKSNAKSLHTLSGHTNTVSCLTWEKNFLVSGSWDHTAIVWYNWEKQTALKGHTGPIWSVAIFHFDSDGQPIVLTASADRTIIMWKQGVEIKTFRGHTDCVRGLAVRNEEEFLSCSNDATIRLWNKSGDNLAKLYGHTNFIYSIICIPSRNIFISGAEDKTIRVWDTEGNNTQTITLPGQSVWCVGTLPNGDIVAGSSDHKAYVFTCHSELRADEQVTKAFDDRLAKSTIVETIGGMKKSDMPDATILLTPGRRDGQTTMVRDGDLVICHRWSEADRQWTKMGEVVGGAGGTKESSGQVLHDDGQQYDFVFDVDADGDRQLKLPYNRSEDPFFAAQRFIERHQLPASYLQEVAEFIQTNAGVSSSAGLQGFQDPFTGGARYVPQGSGEATTSSSNGCGNKYFPQKGCLQFAALNKAGVLLKLRDSNGKVAACHRQLDDSVLTALVDTVCSEEADVALVMPLERALEWPVEQVWPALDVLRLALRFNNVQVRWLTGDKGSSLLALVCRLLNSTEATVQLMCFRCLANMASHQPGRLLLTKNRNLLLGAVFGAAPFRSKNIDIAAATLLLNYCSMMLPGSSLDDKFELLGATAKFIIHSDSEEAIFRVFVGIGTLLWAEDKVKSYAESLDLKSLLCEKMTSFRSSVKITECGDAIVKML